MTIQTLDSRTLDVSNQCYNAFCWFNDDLCKTCFDFCEHSYSDTEYSNVSLAKHEIKECKYHCNICLEIKPSN